MIKRYLTSLVYGLSIGLFCSFSAMATVCFLPDGNCGGVNYGYKDGSGSTCTYKTRAEANLKKGECEEVQKQGFCFYLACSMSKSDCDKAAENAPNHDKCCVPCGNCWKVDDCSIPDIPTCKGAGYETEQTCKNQNLRFKPNGKFEKNGTACGTCENGTPPHPCSYWNTLSQTYMTEAACRKQGGIFHPGDDKDSDNNICGTCDPEPETCTSGYTTAYQSQADCQSGETFSSKGMANGKVCGKCTAKTCPSGYSTQYQSQKDCGANETFSKSGTSGSLTCGKCTKVVKPIITIKTKEVQGECEEWEDDNGNIHNCLAKVITSFNSQASDGKSYNVSLSINGRNIVTDYEGNEINNENSQHCKYTMANYPQNIPENTEICTYEADEFTIYTEDDQIECNVSSMPEYLAVNVNGETVLSNLKISEKGFPLNDFNGKTYETDNYTIKFIQAVDYCKDISNSYISQNDSCSSTQDRVIVNGVTAEKDGQCYTCVTKSEYADKATLCCSLGYQERDYMGVIRDWYEWKGSNSTTFHRSDCQTIDLMWRDVIKEYQNNADYETEYSRTMNYPDKYGCLNYGNNGKWHIGWFGFDAEESTAGCGISEDNRAWDFGPYIEGSLYNYTSQIQDGFYKQRLILSNKNGDESDVATVCGDDIQKWLDSHKSSATMCRYNFTTVTNDDEAYYIINNIENDMMNHCWYRDAYGRDVTDSIDPSKRAKVAKNKIEPMDSSIKDNTYLVGKYAEKYNDDLVNTCKGYNFNKDRLTPLIVDMKD